MSDFVIISIVAVVVLALLIKRMDRQGKALQKMCWVFFHQYILLNDDRAKNGFRLVYCILSNHLKIQFREMMGRKYIAFSMLKDGTIDDPELSGLPADEVVEMMHLMEDVLPRISDCQAYALERSDVPPSHLRAIKQLFSQEDEELVQAVNKANLSFALNLHPKLDVTDYHVFAAQ